MWHRELAIKNLFAFFVYSLPLIDESIGLRDRKKKEQTNQNLYIFLINIQISNRIIQSDQNDTREERNSYRKQSNKWQKKFDSLFFYCVLVHFKLSLSVSSSFMKLLTLLLDAKWLTAIKKKKLKKQRNRIQMINNKKIWNKITKKRKYQI